MRTTQAADHFLKQFDFSDGATAAALIDSLILVSHDKFQAGLSGSLRLLINESQRPLALYAVREADASPYFDSSDPKHRPSAVRSGARVGSEGTIAHLLRDTANTYGTSKVLDHPTVAAMRAGKVWQLVIVDDRIGSGQRMTKFIRSLSRHSTIKSWLSYGYVRIVVVANASTIAGSRLVESERHAPLVGLQQPHIQIRILDGLGERFKVGELGGHRRFTSILCFCEYIL